jgi:RecB family exonuclease
MPLKLTPSRLRDYQTCPLQYRLKHVDRLASSATVHSPALSFGNSLHAALQTLHQDGSAYVEAHEIPLLLRQLWKAEGYTSREQEETQFQLGVTALQNYLRKFGEVSGIILGTELYLSRLIAHDDLRFELACRADRIELHPDAALEILDYKTNADGDVPSAEFLLNDLPTFIYYLLARIVYPKYPRVTVAQLNLIRLNKVTVEYSDSQRSANKVALLNIVRQIEEENFEPHNGAHCAWCAVRAHCPEVNTLINLESL